MENAEMKTVASVGVPETSADLQKVLPQGQGGMVTVVLAAIAVLGGSAGWKFWQSRAKLKHEEVMKKMEIDAELAKAEITKKEAEEAAKKAAAEAEVKKAEAEAAEAKKTKKKSAKKPSKKPSKKK